VRIKTPELSQESYLARLGVLFAEEDAVEACDEADQVADGRPVGDRPRRMARIARFTAQHLKVLSVLGLAAVIVATWAVMQARTVALDEPIPVPTWTDASPTPSPTPQLWRVHVVGAVVSPGVVSLPPGSRVIDAITAAGGLAADADPAQLNLAAVLVDGCQILIGTVGRPAGEVRQGTGGDSSSVPGSPPTTGVGTTQAKVNLNQATEAQLDTLPGVGPVTAQAILAWRQQNGQFTSVAQLQEVSGIGPKAYAQIEPYVTV